MNMKSGPPIIFKIKIDRSTGFVRTFENMKAMKTSRLHVPSSTSPSPRCMPSALPFWSIVDDSKSDINATKIFWYSADSLGSTLKRQTRRSIKPPTRWVLFDAFIVLFISSMKRLYFRFSISSARSFFFILIPIGCGEASPRISSFPSSPSLSLLPPRYAAFCDQGKSCSILEPSLPTCLLPHAIDCRSHFCWLERYSAALRYRKGGPGILIPSFFWAPCTCSKQMRHYLFHILFLPSWCASSFNNFLF